MTDTLAHDDAPYYQELHQKVSSIKKTVKGHMDMIIPIAPHTHDFVM